jgi:ABC-type multidrug transport system fused ATPase/permease subunit
VVIFVSIPIAGCTLAASVAGGLTERKRPFSMLRLTGAPLRMLQRVVALESAVPLIAVAALSIAAGFGATALFLRAQLHYSLASPGLGYLGIVLAVLVLALAIIAATFPLLARITGPETARNELGSRPHGRTYPSRGITDMINLGLRLTMHGGREALVRLVLLVAAVGVGVGLLLVTIAGVNAVNNQDDHYAWISSGLAALTEGGPHGSAEPLWCSIQGSMFEGQAIGVVDVAGTGPASPVVRARNLRKDYGSGEGLVRAVDGIDLDVIRGETVAVMGPSGCGKSTLLHLLGGLDRPTAGELWLAGQRIDEMSERALAHLRRSDIGFVFQAFQLLPALAGALLGIPVGIALYGTVQTGESQAGLPLLWVLFLVLGMLAAVVALTAVPTTISTRQPIAQILQSETA